MEAGGLFIMKNKYAFVGREESIESRSLSGGG